MRKEGVLDRAFTCLETAQYAWKTLQKIAIDPWCNSDAINIVFPALQHAALSEKWQITIGGENNHMFCTPGVTKEKIDEFVADILTLEANRLLEAELVP